MNSSVNVKQILSENLRVVLLRLSVPVMVSSLLQTLYNITDTFWVSKLGSYAIASVTISFPIVFFMIALAIGVSVGNSILIAHSVGKAFNSRKRSYSVVNDILSQTFITLFFLALFFSIIGFLLTPKLVSLMSSDELVVENSIIYLRTIFVGFIFMFVYFVFESSLRALGDTRTPMKFVFFSVLLNIVLDPLMIFGIGFPKMGVFGAALATVIARSSIAFVALYYLLKARFGLKLVIKKPDFKIIAKILRLGIPSSIDMASISIGSFLLVSIVGSLGTIALASYGIVTRLFSLFLIPANAVSVSLVTVVAQNCGAKNMSRVFRALKESFLIGSVIIVVISFFTFLFAPQIVSLFTQDSNVLNNSVLFLRIIAPSFILVVLRKIFLGFFNGIKRTELSMFVTLMHSFVFRIGFAYLFIFILKLGFLGVSLTFPTMIFCSSMIAYLIFIRVKNKIIRERVEVLGLRTKQELKGEFSEDY